MCLIHASGKISIASSVKIKPALKIGEITIEISFAIFLTTHSATGVSIFCSVKGKFLDASYNNTLVTFLAAILTL